MEIQKAAVAGTLESSDAQVTVEPRTGGIHLELSSSVMNQYGRQIKATVLETLERLGVTNAQVTVVDKGEVPRSAPYLRHPCPGQRGGCQDPVRHPGPYEGQLHSGYLYPCDRRYAP